MGLAILFYLYRHLELADTLRLLQHGVRYEYLLLSLPFGLLGNAARGYRWHLQMRPLYAPPARPINPILITIGSYAVSFVIPRAGEVWRCTEMKQREGYALSATVGTLLIDRLSDAVVVLALLVTMMLFQPGAISQILTARGLSLGGGLERLFSSDYTTAWIIAGVSLLVIILVLYRFRKSSFMQRVKEKLRSVLQGASSCFCLICPLHPDDRYPYTCRCRPVALCCDYIADSLWRERSRGGTVCPDCTCCTDSMDYCRRGYSYPTSANNQSKLQEGGRGYSRDQ